MEHARCHHAYQSIEAVDTGFKEPLLLPTMYLVKTIHDERRRTGVSLHIYLLIVSLLDNRQNPFQPRTQLIHVSYMSTLRLEFQMIRPLHHHNPGYGVEFVGAFNVERGNRETRLAVRLLCKPNKVTHRELSVKILIQGGLHIRIHYGTYRPIRDGQLEHVFTNGEAGFSL